ncbi:hypothetical protein BDV24DRAFT_5916 [Aspergillus arachidicola]|uniref:Uncharacterized protein n=1 Tax=Aspergillus arachidicola TaxID=656916 RepID=A0A5N6XT66_9EURO|nr:hypothetical protein BDV24DRAFT_5916 [Aspergillus arachidicola]
MPQAINLERSAPPFLVGGMGDLPYSSTLHSSTLLHTYCTIPIPRSPSATMELSRSYQSPEYPFGAHSEKPSKQTLFCLDHLNQFDQSPPSTIFTDLLPMPLIYILPGFERQSISVESQGSGAEMNSLYSLSDNPARFITLKSRQPFLPSFLQGELDQV